MAVPTLTDRETEAQSAHPSLVQVLAWALGAQKDQQTPACGGLLRPRGARAHLLPFGKLNPGVASPRKELYLPGTQEGPALPV